MQQLDLISVCNELEKTFVVTNEVIENAYREQIFDVLQGGRSYQDFTIQQYLPVLDKAFDLLFTQHMEYDISRPKLNWIISDSQPI